jgi:hypothetical protein
VATFSWLERDLDQPAPRLHPRAPPQKRSARSQAARRCETGANMLPERVGAQGPTHDANEPPFASTKMSSIRRCASPVPVDQQPQTTGCSSRDFTNTARSESCNGSSGGPMTSAPPIDAKATLRSIDPSRRTRTRRVVTTNCLGTPTSPVRVVLPSSPGCSHQSSTFKGGRTRSSGRAIARTRGSSGARNRSPLLIVSIAPARPSTTRSAAVPYSWSFGNRAATL